MNKKRNNKNLFLISSLIIIGLLLSSKSFLLSDSRENKHLQSATPSSSPSPQINNGKFIWQGGRYIDQGMRISFEVPKNWSINPLPDDRNPGLQIYSNNQALTKGKRVESDLVEKIEIIRTKKADTNNDYSTNSSEIILSESTILLNNKYTAKRTDVFSTWDGFKQNITFLSIEYKDETISFTIYNTEFFNRPETQALFNSIEIVD